MPNKYIVDNAIILAAGRGSRLNELTKITPKPLLKNKKGIPLIEDIIMKIKEKGINKIIVVVGYKWKMFMYLSAKYNIEIIRNREWQTTNNPSSINVALLKMKNSLIVNGDVVMNKNIIESSFSSSITYGEKNSKIDEWLIITDKDKNIIDFDKNGINGKGFYQREITFITSELVEKIKYTLVGSDHNQYFEYLFINTAQMYGIDFKIHEIERNMITDIDNIKQFKKYVG